MIKFKINKTYEIDFHKKTKEATKPWIWEYSIHINGQYCGYIAKYSKNIPYCRAWSSEFGIDIQAKTFNEIKKQVIEIIKEKLQCRTNAIFY